MVTTGLAAGTSRATRDLRDQLCDGVLPSDSIIEDRGIQRPPRPARDRTSLRDHLADRVEDPVRTIRRRQYVNVGGWNQA